MITPTHDTSANAWYFEYLDRIANLEFKNKPEQQGGTELRYRIAREQQGDSSICGKIAGALMPLTPGSTVILITGTGNPTWLPHGETDGPSGVAILARVFAGLGVRSCVLSEERFLPGVAAAVQAGGTPLLDEPSWRERNNAAWVLPFPTGEKAAKPFIEDLLTRLPNPAAGFFVEKPGPNTKGVFHNSSGKPKDTDWVAHAHLLVHALRERGALTIAVGDGGNEIGFGLINGALSSVHAYGRDCGCPCHGGLIDATPVDLLLPAAVSNWGAYAIACAVALAARRHDIMPSWDDVYRSIAAPISFGVFDGYSGLAVDTVDGISRSANEASFRLMEEVLRLASTQA